MLIAVKQVAGLDFQAANLYRLTEFNNVSVCVRNSGMMSEYLKARRRNSGKIANRTVCYINGAGKCSANVGVDLSEKSA